MSRPLAILLIFWNVVLSVLVGYALTRGQSPAQIEDRTDGPELSQRPDTLIASPRDSMELKDARIAYFNTDSINENYLMVQESKERVASERKKLQQEFDREMQRAQAEIQELSQKDPTYSTQAQLQADQQRFQELQAKIADLRDRSEMKLEDLQIKVLEDINKEVEDYLEEYNRSAGFDYIFTIQNGGQIWVGNNDLDITAEVLKGLNARHSAKKAGK
jgi:Skp family chaperone for outer membrane proteins